MNGIVDLNDPASIRRWVAINPARHLAQLRGLYRLWPQFSASIAEGAKA